MRYILYTGTAVLVLILAACAPIPPQGAGPVADEAPAERSEADPAQPDEPETAIDAQQPPAESAPDETSTAEPQADPDGGEAAASEPAAQPAPSEPEPAAPAADADLTGRVHLTGGDADPAEAVVYFVPGKQAAASADPAAANFEIVTEDKALRPTVLAVPAGATLRFPNRDPILHNLFSVSPDNDFDLGVYGPGEAPAVTLDTPGVVNIYCNVHHDMHAHVLVVDSPWHDRPDAQGRFRLTGLPAGPGELHVWHRQSDRWSQSVQLPQDGSLAIELRVTRPSLPPHRDKTGQPYNRRDRDPYR